MIYKEYIQVPNESLVTFNNKNRHKKYTFQDNASIHKSNELWTGLNFKNIDFTKLHLKYL